ncbi:DNA-3-methyladenine glycosylase I [Hyphomonas johnsonii]|uniref:DNA-3-methyladenine glycosylase I n=1 Tax=Hyphomonas johnsonii MHS-2 TaxID=1280950 RepID=A0A059FFN0_9PROT|nr:DNA-3-methyladenine glycosylase I [Hyphomonas johnsonii]KCZ89424.1 DNA-3-methyladenine glycosylase I [Hyphomonas johnsonii MHS-2]
MTDRLHCAWAPADDAIYRAYHDEEWGVPERDSRALWEKLQLDGMQAGLSWITILRKRDSLREEFDGFDPERLVRWTPKRIDKALQNPGIIRSPAKIAATIGNARAYLDMMAAGEDFSAYCWSHVGGQPIVGKWTDFRKAPTFTDWSTAMSKDLKKRGFKFVGPTIVYAWAQAVGMVNDHEIHCPRHAEVQRK